jgi:hypothetical protein
VTGRPFGKSSTNTPVTTVCTPLAQGEINICSVCSGRVTNSAVLLKSPDRLIRCFPLALFSKTIDPTNIHHCFQKNIHHCFQKIFLATSMPANLPRTNSSPAPLILRTKPMWDRCTLFPVPRSTATCFFPAAPTAASGNVPLTHTVVA